MDILNIYTYLQRIYDYVENIFINTLIIKKHTINSNDDLLTQFKCFILRYRRIIGIILLCILLYLDSNCNNYITYTSKSKNIKGGGGSDAAGAGSGTGTQETGTPGTSIVPDYKKGYNEGMQIYEKGKGKLKDFVAKDGKFYNAGAYAGNKFKDFSGWLYQFLFSIAITIAICMIILPSLSFLIIGIICYFLFKKKMSSIKSI